MNIDYVTTGQQKVDWEVANCHLDEILAEVWCEWGNKIFVLTSMATKLLLLRMLWSEDFRQPWGAGNTKVSRYI